MATVPVSTHKFPLIVDSITLAADPVPIRAHVWALRRFVVDGEAVLVVSRARDHGTWRVGVALVRFARF